MILQPKPLVWLLSLALSPALASAQPVAVLDAAAGRPAAKPKPSVPALPRVQVIANLAGSIQLDTPGTVSVITREQMDRQLVSNIRELIRYEPGVSVIASAGRFGLDSFNIRGLSGNRSAMLVDGIPMPASLGADVAGGSFRTGRDYIDLDTIQSVKIIRGPSSALYGSDALGGTVVMQTKDPSDYLGSARTVYSALKTTYDGSDRSFGNAVTLAGGNRHDALLVLMNHSDGHETANQGEIGGTGATRSRIDPMRYHQTGFLLKYVHTASHGRIDRYTLEGLDRRTRTNGLSNVTASTPYYRAQDDNRRLRASVGQWLPQLTGPLADRLDWNLYWQQSTAHTRTQTQNGLIQRFYDTTPTNERVLGGRVVAVKALDTGAGFSQQLSYGAEAAVSFDSAAISGYGYNTRTGGSGSDKNYLPGNYPLHLLPSSSRRYALFGQDQLSLLDGQLLLTPGLRLDHYDYDPSDDGLYRKYNGDYQPAHFNETHAAPKFGVLWHINEVFSAYLDYAHGFRPPLYSELSGSWNEQPIAGMNIAFLPNPQLKSETSRGLELGLRGKGDLGWFSVAGYYNQYRNFIWSGYALDPKQVPSWAQQISPGAFFNLFYQSVNARKAYIKGAEASGSLRLGYFSEALQGWALRGSAALATGRLIEPGHAGYSPLNTVDPAKLVLGLSYDAARWGGQLTATAVRRHSQLDQPDVFRPAGYASLDLYAHYHPSEHVELYAGISNLANRKYWDWGNLNGGTLGNLVTGNGVNDTGTQGMPADRLSMPGRSFSMTARLSF